MSLLRDVPFLDLENSKTVGGKQATQVVKWLNNLKSRRAPFTVKRNLFVAYSEEITRVLLYHNFSSFGQKGSTAKDHYLTD